MKEQTHFSQLALNAMRRAAKQAHKRAAEHNLKVPIWQNGKIVYLDPNKLLTEESK